MKHLVTISTRGGFRAVESNGIFDASGHSFAITPSLKGPGWRGTHLGTGFAVAAGKTHKEARENTRTLVACNLAQFVAQVATLPAAPPAEGLPPAILPVPAKAADLDPVVAAIVATIGECSPEEVAGIRSALSSKTGRLKERAPSDPWGKAAWNGLQPNAWKIQFSACFLPPAPAAFLTRLSRQAWPAALDRDLSVLRSLGVA